VKKLILYLTAILFILGGCKKTNSTPPQPAQGIGGYGIGKMAGLFNITLSRNSDTTIVVPIKVYVTVYGNWTPNITINFGPFPRDIVGATPASYSSYASTFITYVTDTVAFQIHATDTGTFPIAVFANCNGGSPSELSDSFNIIVH